MPESYMSKDVLCPYYHKEIQNKICCEGIDDDSSIHLNFVSGKRRIEYEKAMCCRGYDMCLIAQALNKKWDGG